MGTLKTVQSIVKVLKILSLIFAIISLVGAAVSLLGAIVMFILPSVLDDNIRQVLASMFSLDADATDEFFKMTGITMIAAVIGALGGAVVMFFSFRYLKKVEKDGTPFTFSGANELMQLGIITIAVLFAANMLASAIGGIAMSSMFNSLLNSELGSELTYSMSTEVSASSDITLGIVMILLSFVFKYGAEIDERRMQLEDEIYNKEDESPASPAEAVAALEAPAENIEEEKAE